MLVLLKPPSWLAAPSPFSLCWNNMEPARAKSTRREEDKSFVFCLPPHPPTFTLLLISIFALVTSNQ